MASTDAQSTIAMKPQGGSPFVGKGPRRDRHENSLVSVWW